MKLFLKLAFAAIVLLLLAVTAVVVIIDPNDYKQQIQDQVKNNINRELAIKGDLSWSLYPLLGFNIGEVTLQNSPEFTEKTLLTVKETAISISVFPLFKGKLEVGEIILDGVQFNLITNKDGLSNLDNLEPAETAAVIEAVENTEKTTETPTQDESQVSTPTDPAEPSDPLDLSEFVLSGISITNAQIKMIDHQTNDNQDITINSMILNEFAFDETSKFSLSSTVKNNQVEAEFTLTTDILVDAALTKLSLNNLTFDSEVLSQALLGTKITTALKTGIDYQLETQQLDINTISIINKLTGPLLQGDVVINLNEINVKENNEVTLGALTIASSLSGSSLQDHQVDTSFNTNLAANIKNKTAKISAFDLKNKIAGKGANGHFNLSLKQIDVSDFEKILIKSLNIDSELDGELLTAGKLNAAIKTNIAYDLNQQKLSLTALKTVINKLRLDGELSFINQDIPVVRYDLKGNVWDLNPYLPAKEESTETASEQPAPPSPEETAEATQPDLSILNQLDVEGDFALEGILYEEIVIGKFTKHLIIKNGKASLKPLTAQLYDGSLYVNAWVDDAKGKNKYEATTNIKDITLMPLLKAAAQVDMLSGKANFNVVANGQGLIASQIQEGINAKGDFKILDGELYGINLSQELRTFKAKIKGKTLAEDKQVKKTDFASLSGLFTMKEGVANNQKLTMISPVLRLDGTGLADTLKETINYKLGVTPLSSSTEETDYVDLNGITIPLVIQGTFTEPTFKLDTDSALKGQIEANKKALQDKAKKALENQLKGKSNDDLKEEGKKLESQFKSFFK